MKKDHWISRLKRSQIDFLSLNFLNFLDKLEQAMCEIFTINVISHASKTNQQFVYLLNLMYIYVVAKLLTFLCFCVFLCVCVCFEFSTWVSNFARGCIRGSLISRFIYNREKREIKYD